MNSFIGWVGGKKNLKGRILSEFPEKGTYNRYVEVFGGAGWVLFAADRHAKTEIYNDINGSLVNLFRCVKYHPEEMQKELELIVMSREQYCDARAQIKMRGLTDIQRAARFFIIIKESFGSDLHSFKCQPGNLCKAREFLLKVSERLKSVIVENQDFQKIISNNDKAETLFYLDPPYYAAEDYYSVKFTAEDHLRLKESLSNVKGKFILSYNDCDYIREQYKEYNMIEVDREHNLLANRGGGRYSELIIKNFM